MVAAMTTMVAATAPTPSAFAGDAAGLVGSVTQPRTTPRTRCRPPRPHV